MASNDSERKLLIQLYVVEDLTTGEAAAKCGMSEETFRQRLIDYGIERKRRGPRKLRVELKEELA